MINEERHKFWMRKALDLAKVAVAHDEVPVGAIVVMDDQIVGSGFNQSISTSDPTAHAEIIALREAASKIGNYRLVNAELFVTLEPCIMCVGAMLHARIKRLVYGAPDPKTGAIQSVFRLLDEKLHNHQIVYDGDILADECGKLLRDFFSQKRKK